MAHGITGLTWIIGYDFISRDGASNYSSVDRTTTAYGVVNINTTNLIVTTNTDRSAFTASYCTLYYTK